MGTLDRRFVMETKSEEKAEYASPKMVKAGKALQTTKGRWGLVLDGTWARYLG